MEKTVAHMCLGKNNHFSDNRGTRDPDHCGGGGVCAGPSPTWYTGRCTAASYLSLSLWVLLLKAFRWQYTGVSSAVL